jgi:hypothetical protein
VRYAGIFFVAALGVVMLARLASLRSRRSLAELVLALVPPTLTTVALLARNYLLVGDAKGGNAHELARPATEVLALFSWAAQGLVGYSRTGLEAGRPAELFLIAVVVALVGLALAAGPEWRGGLATRLLRDAGPALALVYVGVSLGAMWHLERTRYLGVSTRMLLPLVPFGLVLLATSAPAVRWRNARLGAGALVTLLAAAYLVGQASLLPPRDLIRRAEKLRGLRLAIERSEEVRQLLSQDGTLGRPLLTNEPHPMGLLLAQPVVGLTSADYSATRWTPEATERLVRHYGVRHVVLFPLEENSNQQFFEALARGDVPRWLSPIPVDADLQLFEVRE